ncbi:MAG: filamentous hemagglutinin N-terminal domain-containing protein, partial [Betaproteobacteria bacterium]|nr:filamentous hemagglutinin N-terminal domain-containing protein [Betaproteobacteria bacterium]
MKDRPRKSPLNRKLVALAVAACFVTEWAYANPTAPTVVHGAAAFQQAGNLLQITNSPNAIINWGSFSIGASEITRFIQQSQASAVLNRVIGQDPSSILGALQSNGRVFLINPNGILFGAGAQIDVAGLVASTLNLSNADFLAGRLKFTEVPGAGSIVNQGNITTGQGGQVYLVGPAVTNSGIITSPGGEVILAAGNSVELVNPGTPDLRVEITAPDNEARNLGQIVADSGRVGIYAGLIKHSGTIRADSAQVTEDGRIVLKATKEVTLEAGSVTTANGPTGGRIEIHSGDTTLVAGTVEVKGTPSPLMGEGEGGGGTGKGGTIHILGNKVGVIDAARLDASGATGGGTVLIGGDYQGRNPEIQNAYRTYFGPSARVAADAVTAGDGGKVIVWSDDATRAYGTITARGGAQSGNGGFVEVSGKNWLDFNASVDVRAPNGVTGALLLDPNSVEIGNTDSFGGGSFDDLIPNVFSSSSDGLSQIAWSTVKSNLAASAVYITTLGDTTSGNADITVSANSPDLDTTNTLRLLSNRHVTVNGSITNTKAGALEMFAGWDGASTTAPAVSSFGNITLNSGISVSGDVSLIANNDITQGVSGIISANKLLVSSNSGSVLLNTATSMVNTLAGRANDQFLFKNGQSLTIDTVGATSGITVNNTSSGNSTVDVQITSGSLAVNKNISATGGNAFSGGAATVTLTSPNGITVNNLSAVSATGGNGSGSGNGGDATLQANAGGTIDLTGSTLTATGGVGGGFGNPGTGTVKLEVSTASGNGTPSGDIIAHNITADNINLQQQSDAGNRSILRASASSLIQAGDLLMEIDYPGSTSGGSIGTSAEPMRVQVARLEAHTHEASPGIFIESPNAGNLQIGGVSFFTGSVKGVQNVTSGDISLSVNGTLTLQAGTAGCGATGGTGGPICTGGSTVTLTANDMSLGNSVNANTGTVMLAPFATSRNINIEGPTPTVGTLSLNTGELQQITAGTLQIGRSTDTGTLTVATAVGSGDVTASTLKLAHQNIAINGALNVGTNTLVLTATGTVEQTAPITAGTLELLGAGGEHALTDPANQIGTVKANTGSVTLVNDGALVVSGISTGGVGAETIVAASPLVAGEQFGGSIAVKGDVMIVGAPGTFQTGIGAVYVYRWNGTAWVFEAKLVPPDSIARNFGTGVAVEGTHAVVGAPETTDVNFRSGAAYAFEFDGSSWGSGTKLAFSQKVFESVFGVSAAIDNNRLVIGGNGRTSEGGFWTGKIWFYDFVSGAWVERGNARQSDPQSNDYFGLDLAISGDRMIVGAPNTFASTGQQGKAYIFEFNPTTRVWLQTQKLTATGGAAADFFGRGVAISGDVAVVGAQRADPGGVTDGGKAYVFRFNGTSWVQEQALVPSDVAASDFFGERVAVRDGTIVASSFGQDPGGISGAGAAYVFRHDGSQWVQDEKIVASNGVVSDQLGRGGMVLADDDKIYIGAQFADPGAVVNAGAVYTYAPLANSTLTG